MPAFNHCFVGSGKWIKATAILSVFASAPIFVSQNASASETVHVPSDPKTQYSVIDFEVKSESTVTVKTFESSQIHTSWNDVLDTATADDTDVIIYRSEKPIVAVVAYEDYLAVQQELARLRSLRQEQRQVQQEALVAMLASETVLAREWDTPEEDEAWADL